MSFGVSVTDFATLAVLAKGVYRAFRDYGSVYQGIANEAAATHAVLKRLEDEAKDGKSMLHRCTLPKQNDLRQLLGGLKHVLEELDTIIRQCDRPGKVRKVGNAYRLATKDLGALRAKLTFHLSAITAFTDSLARDTLARIETLLLEQVREVKAGGKPDPRSVRDGFRGVEQDLARRGVQKKDIERYRVAIMSFVLGSLGGGAMGMGGLYGVANAVRERRESQGSSGVVDVDFGAVSDVDDSSDEEVERGGWRDHDGEGDDAVRGFGGKALVKGGHDSESGSDSEGDSDGDSDGGGFGVVAKVLPRLAGARPGRFARKAMHLLSAFEDIDL